MVFGSPNVTTIIGLSQYVNTVTGGVFWSLMLFVFFIISFALLSGHGLNTALPASAFITTIIAILLRAADLFTGNAEIFVCVIASFVSALFAYFNGSNTEG